MSAAAGSADQRPWGGGGLVGGGGGALGGAGGAGALTPQHVSPHFFLILLFAAHLSFFLAHFFLRHFPFLSLPQTGSATGVGGGPGAAEGVKP